MSRQFVEFQRLDHDAVLDALNLQRQTVEQQGRRLARFRSWPGNLPWLILLAPQILVLGLWLTNGDWSAWSGILFMVVIAAALWTLPFIIEGLLERADIHEHGVVVGIRKRYVIPFESIDPGRVVVVRRMWFLLRHLEMASPPTRRTGQAASTGVSFNGADSTPQGVERIEYVAPELAMTQSTLMGQTLDILSPFTRWYVGTRRPEKFVRTLEAAMVADGYPVAGLADAALKRRVVLSWQPPDDVPGAAISPIRRWTDPVTPPTRAER